MTWINSPLPLPLQTLCRSLHALLGAIGNPFETGADLHHRCLDLLDGVRQLFPQNGKGRQTAHDFFFQRRSRVRARLALAVVSSGSKFEVLVHSGEYLVACMD